MLKKMENLSMLILIFLRKKRIKIKNIKICKNKDYKKSNKFQMMNINKI